MSYYKGESCDKFGDVTLPPLPKKWGSDRMIVRGFRALVHPFGRNRGRTCIVANVDPKCPVPKSLLNFVIKKMAGILLYLLMKEAEKVSNNPTTNKHAIRIAEDPNDFYKWLKPRMELYFTKMDSKELPSHLDIPTLLRKQQNSPIVIPVILEVNSTTNQSIRGETTSTPEHLKASPHTIGNFIVHRFYDSIIWPYFLLIWYIWIKPPSVLFLGLMKLLTTILTAFFSAKSLISWSSENLKNPKELERNQVLLNLPYIGLFCIANTVCVVWTANYVGWHQYRRQNELLKYDSIFSFFSYSMSGDVFDMKSNDEKITVWNNHQGESVKKSQMLGLEISSFLFATAMIVWQIRSRNRIMQ